jgi:hypothetical protein
MRYYLAVAAALAMQLSAAQAQNMVALIGDDILATVDARALKTTGLTKIEGLGPVLGVDMRPADGLLYALAADGTIATIDLATGKATAKSKLDTLPPADARITVDFNPVADKLRIIGSDGTNLRADVDSGKVTKDQSLKFAETDPAAGQTPQVVAGAYSNAFKGTKETTLYDIDAGNGGVFRQVPPNDGVLNTIGALGVDAQNIGFDIVADGAGGNTAMLVAGGGLYTVDLASGKAEGGKQIAGLPADLRDIALLTAPMQKQADMMMMAPPAPMAPAPATAPMTAPAGMEVKAKGETTSGYLPDQPKAAPKMKAGFETKMNVEKKPQYRADYGSPKGAAYSAPKTKKAGGPQCDERKSAQY